MISMKGNIKINNKNTYKTQVNLYFKGPHN